MKNDFRIQKSVWNESQTKSIGRCASCFSRAISERACAVRLRAWHDIRVVSLDSLNASKCVKWYNSVSMISTCLKWQTWKASFTSRDKRCTSSRPCEGIRCNAIKPRLFGWRFKFRDSWNGDPQCDHMWVATSISSCKSWTRQVIQSKNTEFCWAPNWFSSRQAARLTSWANECSLITYAILTSTHLRTRKSGAVGAHIEAKIFHVGVLYKPDKIKKPVI